MLAYFMILDMHIGSTCFILHRIDFKDIDFTQVDHKHKYNVPSRNCFLLNKAIGQEHWH